jgi:ribosomal protein S18 acetylase RimI-like enzyme
MTAAIEVRRATSADAATLGETLADAFSEDPVISWLLPPTIRNRPQRLRKLFTSTAESYLRRDQPAYLTADGQGAALWAAPGSWLAPPSEQLHELLPMIGVFRGGLIRASRLQTQMLKAHPHPKHWYLYCLGTRADAQGRGLGSAMLREVLDRVDAAGESAYLESSNIRNVPLYERHGFTVVEEIRIDRGGPPMWRMWRDPE